MKEKLYYNLCDAEQRKEYFQYRIRKTLRRNFPKVNEEIVEIAALNYDENGI